VAQHQQHHQQHSASSSTDSFILAALLLGCFLSPSSAASSSAPVIQLCNALLSISATGNFSDIAHWGQLLFRRRDVAAQVHVHAARRFTT
jgi:hypothetical protein